MIKNRKSGMLLHLISLTLQIFYCPVRSTEHYDENATHYLCHTVIAEYANLNYSVTKTWKKSGLDKIDVNFCLIKQSEGKLFFPSRIIKY